MNKDNSIVLIGGGGHALSCSEVIYSVGKYTLAGFLDINSDALLARYNVAYLGSDDIIETLVSEGYGMVIGIGQIHTEKPRLKIYERLKKNSAFLPKIIAPSAYIAQDVHLDEGCLIFHKAIINRSAIIGANSIINNAAVIEHNVKIGKNCHIAPNATILGDVTIKDGSFIGAGATIFPGVTVAETTVIGAGANIKKDVASNEIIR